MKKLGIFLGVVGLVFMFRPASLTEQPKHPSNNTQTKQAEVLPEVQIENVTSSGVKKIKHVDIGDNFVKLEGEIDSLSVSAVLSELQRKAVGKAPVYLLINSPGGSVLDGSRLVSFIENSKTPIYTVCTKLCASMAFVTLQYGHKRMALDRAIIMAHKASGGAQGQLENMINLLSTMKRYVDKMSLHTARKAGLTLEQFNNLTANDLWLDAEDAVAKKFLDEIITIDEPISNNTTTISDQSKSISDAWEKLKL